MASSSAHGSQTRPTTEPRQTAGRTGRAWSFRPGYDGYDGASHGPSLVTVAEHGTLARATAATVMLTDPRVADGHAHTTVHLPYLNVAHL